MGAWTNLALAPGTLNGLAEIDFPDSTRQGDIDNDRVASAKRLVVTLTRRHLRDTILLYDGEVAFFDAVAASTDLASVREEMIGYAYLYLTYQDDAGRPGRGTGPAQKAAEYYDPKTRPPSGLLVEAMKGFSEIAPAILSIEAGEDAEDVQGRTAYSGVISVTNSWG